MNEYDANTTNEQLKVMRHLLVSARRVLWDIDEGKTSDGHFSQGDKGMHPRVRQMQNSLDQSIMVTAWMQDDLNKAITHDKDLTALMDRGIIRGPA